MKLVKLTLMACAAILIFNYCSPAKNAAKTIAKVPVTYETNVQKLITANCSPCHIPARGGQKYALDNYDNVSKSIDDIISRIEKKPTDRGFMPFKHEKLSDSTINIFKQWKIDGLAAK